MVVGTEEVEVAAGATVVVPTGVSRGVRATSRCRRPASHTEAIPGVPIGLATRANNASNGFGPSRARAWKIADFDGIVKLSAQPEAHDNPSVNWLSTSS